MVHPSGGLNLKGGLKQNWLRAMTVVIFGMHNVVKEADCSRCPESVLNFCEIYKGPLMRFRPRCNRTYPPYLLTLLPEWSSKTDRVPEVDAFHSLMTGESL
jgi:hypothetical protein